MFDKIKLVSDVNLPIGSRSWLVSVFQLKSKYCRLGRPFNTRGSRYVRPLFERNNEFNCGSELLIMSRSAFFNLFELTSKVRILARPVNRAEFSDVSWAFDNKSVCRLVKNLKEDAFRTKEFELRSK